MYKVSDFAFHKLCERYRKWTGRSFDESPVRYSRLFCTRWNVLTKSRGVMDAMDESEYVERSYHEALVNAIVNRDYLINGSECILISKF